MLTPVYPADQLAISRKDTAAYRRSYQFLAYGGRGQLPDDILACLAIRAGADARFTETSRVLAHLAGGRADHTWDKRLAELTRPAVLVLDDFGMRELTAALADDLYELITERAGRSLILTSNRAPAD
jgi:hypothetical protein